MTSQPASEIDSSQKDFSIIFYDKILPILFLAWGCILLFSLLGAFLHVDSVRGLGYFFFQAFHLASLYLPFYFILIGIRLYKKTLTNRFLHISNWCFIPFLTLALAFKTAFPLNPSTLEKFLLYLFPAPGATVIMLALLALELVILARYWILTPIPIEESTPEKEFSRGFAVHPTTEPKTQQDSPEVEQEDLSAEDLTSKLKQYLQKLDRVDQAKREAFSEGQTSQNPVEPAPEGKVAAEPIEQTLKETRTENLIEAKSSASEGELDAEVENALAALDDKFQKKTNRATPGDITEEADFTQSQPVLSHQTLLSEEEQQALNDMADWNAADSEEEQRIAAVIENTTRNLDNVLEKHEEHATVPPQSTTKTKSLTDGFLDDIEDEFLNEPKNDLQEAVKDKNDTESEESWSFAPGVEFDVADVQQDEEPSVRFADDDEEPETPTAEPQPTFSVPTLQDETAEAHEPFVSNHLGHYHIDAANLLSDYQTNTYWEIDADTKHAANVLEDTLKEFNIEAEVTGIQKGPVITMFELLPAPGVKLSRIEALADNIAFRLAASRVRIVAPIPGKQAVGIEVPNKERALVSFKELVTDTPLSERTDQYLPIVLGKDISGEAQVVDLAKMPHLLIAGSTGSGKSVCVNGIICSFLFSRSPKDVRMILIDPKVVELKPYNDIPHLLTPVITEPTRALQAMQWAVDEMERRYTLLDNMGVRNMRSYNKKIEELHLATERLSYLVIVVDEFADLMASCGKELEGLIARLAAKSRAAGIHLIIATQRPSVDVITGLIKANFPCRIAFMVASKTDSRIILDTGGAEQLLGKGDMLFISSWYPFPVRIQGAFLSEEEVENVCSYVKSLGKPQYIDDEIFQDDEDDFADIDTDAENDPLYEKAVEIVLETGKATASYLQRRLKVGYNRAARLIDTMEKRGVVGPANGSRPREILHP